MRRAHQYVAAAKEEWLYPEQFVSKSGWNTYGDDLLLMPDPRSVEFTSEIIIGNHDGSATAFDEYGRRPWQQDYGASDHSSEFSMHQQFQGDFALKFGSERRGRALSFGTDIDPARDSDDMHAHHLSLARKNRRKK